MIANLKAERNNGIVNPGELIILSGDIYLVLNRTDEGYLLRNCNTSSSLEIDRGQSFKLIKNIRIENR